MALKAVVKDLNEVDEAQRSFYKPHDGGGFRLDAEGVEFEEDVRGLHSALQAERTRAKELEKKVKGMPADFDPEKWAALTEAERNRETEEAQRKGEWDKLRTQMAENHTKELGKKDETIKSLSTQVETLMIENEATRLLGTEELQGNATLLMPHIRSVTKVVKDDDGKYEVHVLDAKGNRRLGTNNEYMKLADLLAEMAESNEYAGAFAGTGATGGGATGRQRAGGTGSEIRTKADFKNDGEKVAWANKHGWEAYHALPDK